MVVFFENEIVPDLKQISLKSAQKTIIFYGKKFHIVYGLIISNIYKDSACNVIVIQELKKWLGWHKYSAFIEIQAEIWYFDRISNDTTLSGSNIDAHNEFEISLSVFFCYEKYRRKNKRLLISVYNEVFEERLQSMILLSAFYHFSNTNVKSNEEEGTLKPKLCSLSLAFFIFFSMQIKKWYHINYIIFFRNLT